LSYRCMNAEIIYYRHVFRQALFLEALLKEIVVKK